MYQQILLSVNGQFFIDREFFQEIDYGPLHFAAQCTEFLYGRTASVILPGHQIPQHFFVQFADRHVRDFLHEKLQALQRHELVVACQTYDIGHFHEKEQRPDGMGSPVKDVPQNV